MSNKPPVLVVDDNAAKRLALRAVLMPLGFPVVQADCGLAALRCVMAQDFAVILLDVCMPTMDGFETAALIRQRRQSEMTPIIFITAFGGDELAYSNRYAQGAVDFIFAPVEPEELRAKVTVFANLFSQSADLVTQAHQAQTSADQLRLLTEAAPIGIFQTDIANRYVYTNPRWSEITGIAAADASGRDWDAVIGSQGSLATQLAESVRDGAEFSHRFEIPQVAGTPRTVVMTSVSIPDSEGAVSGWVGTLLDVTAEAEAEAAISRARDEAKNASQLKSDFLANMSHEIRTPMNGIIGMTDLLLESVLDARQRDYAQTVRSSGEALLGIIDDILDFSKIEAGHLEIENIDYDPASIVDGVLDLLAGGAQAKGLELVAVAEGRPPTVVKGDPGRVRQVLTNLVGNSIKFTTAGEVIVRIAAVEVLAGTAVLRFEVSDTGDGIAADKLEAIFQSFVQADTSTSRKYGGTGLGLSISRELVTLMGGEFGVASELGAGSTFWFTIRVQLPVEQSMHAVTSADTELTGVRVLVVDDNATVRNVLVQWLTEWGVAASAVGAGAAALTALTAANATETPFAVVIVDQSKVTTDGLALKDAILTDPAVTAALMVMTGLGHEAALDAEARSGVLTLLSKPVHRESLRSCLRAAVGLAEPEPVRRAARAGRDVGVGPSTGG
ncbi:MAG: response regulator, partial [Acidimicrobiales bacterium]